MCMRVRTRVVLITALVALSVSMAAPARAAVVSNAEPAQPADDVTTVVATMEWNCDELTAADRKKALADGIRMCGLNEPAPGEVTAMAISTANCGTAVINVGQSGGKANIHYALHSSAGFISGRALNVWWGPTYAGSKYDFGTFWGTSFYGSQLNIGYAMNGKKFGATMSGSVTIVGWYLTCNVYVSEPVRTL